MTTVAQVLLFENSEQSLELGRALWAMFDEIAAVWARLPSPPQVTRYYLAPAIPPSVAAGELAAPLAAEPLRPEQWRYARGRYVRTYEPEKLGEIVRESIHSTPEVLLVVFDQEITPPDDWRYIIWDKISRGAVVSVAPADPMFWLETGVHRLAAIKHRVRTASLCALGKHLGLSRCENPECVLFSEVDSVACLDRMVRFGPEHGLPGLDDMGFDPRPADPEVPQPLVAAPPSLYVA